MTSGPTLESWSCCDTVRFRSPHARHKPSWGWVAARVAEEGEKSFARKNGLAANFRCFASQSKPTITWEWPWML